MNVLFRMTFETLRSCFGMFNLQPWMIGIVIPIITLVFVAVLVISGMYFQHRRRELWHQTARLALEKGQPIPEPSPDAASTGWEPNKAASPRQRARGYLIGGLINVAIGIGMAVSFFQFARFVSYVAAIPFCIGVALLIAAIIEGRAENRSER